jgi:hypothetical protein
MSEKRLTRSSISASTSNESTSSSLSSKKDQLNSIKEEDATTAAVIPNKSGSKEEVATSTTTSKSAQVSTRKSLRRSEAPLTVHTEIATPSSTTTATTPTAVVKSPETITVAVTKKFSSSDLSASTESADSKRSKRLKDQKSVSTLTSQKSSSNIKETPPVEPENAKEEVEQSVTNEQPPVTDVAEQTVSAEAANTNNTANKDAAQPEVVSNSKIITRRRSSNLMNQLRSGSSSSLLSQSLNLGKSKLFSLTFQRVNFSF